MRLGDLKWVKRHPSEPVTKACKVAERAMLSLWDIVHLICALGHLADSVLFIIIKTWIRYDLIPSAVLPNPIFNSTTPTSGNVKQQTKVGEPRALCVVKNRGWRLYNRHKLFKESRLWWNSKLSFGSGWKYHEYERRIWNLECILLVLIWGCHDSH